MIHETTTRTVSLTFICVVVIFLTVLSCDRDPKKDGPEQSTSEEQTQQKKTSDATNTASDTQEQPASQVLANYNRYCAPCHGEQGTGDGPAAEYLYPKPRDLRTGTYKFTSTPYGDLPLDRDLHRTISQGLAGTAMPGFQEILSDKQISDLVDYIKELSPRFEKLPEPDRIEIPDPPEKTEELVQTGKQLYNENACWTCHGRDGSGDGPSAAGLKNDRGHPVKPRDFTKGVYKAGGQPKDLYRTIVTGIPGTGMPAYASALSSEEDRWALVYYVQSLSEESDDGWSLFPSFVDGETTLSASSRADALPTSPDDDAWSGMDGLQLGTFPIWQRPEPAPVLNVKAVHNGDKLALLLNWDDPTKNLQDLKQRAFTDAVAYQLPVDPSGKPPFHGMGDNREDGLVRIWHWRAVRARGAERGEPVGLDDVYRRVFVDRYRGLEEEPGKQEKSPAGAEMREQDEKLQSAMDTGNPLASEELFGRPVLEYISKGFGSLTAVPPDDHHASASSSWTNGSWKVVITRPLSPDAEKDPTLSPGTETWIGFAAFDGAFDERNGKKSVTQWIRFRIEQ